MCLLTNLETAEKKPLQMVLPGGGCSVKAKAYCD
jgi:hypothetical protein